MIFHKCTIEASSNQIRIIYGIEAKSDKKYYAIFADEWRSVFAFFALLQSMQTHHIYLAIAVVYNSI